MSFCEGHGVLRVETNEWLVPIKDMYPKLEEDYLRLEPLQVLENKERTELLTPVRLAWLPGEDFLRRLAPQDKLTD